MGIVADFDIILLPLKRKKDSILFSHKGASHSIIVALLFSLIVSIPYSFITNYPFFFSWMIGFLFYCIHLLFDFITASKVPLFYPISIKRYRFFVDRAINLLLAFISGIIILCFFISAFFIPLENLIRASIIVSLGYLIYLTYRLILKIIMDFKLPNNTIYIPGVLPFNYLIYSRTTSGEFEYFSLIEKSIFSRKNTEIISTKIAINSNLMKFFLKALEVSKHYTFFSKWEALIPIIYDKGNKITFSLFLAETYMRDRAYHLVVKIEKESLEILEEFEDFRMSISSS